MSIIESFAHLSNIFLEVLAFPNAMVVNIDSVSNRHLQGSDG